MSVRRHDRPPVVRQCSAPGCGYATSDSFEWIAHLAGHGIGHTQPTHDLADQL